MEEVLYEERDRIAIITLNRPKVLNAFNAAMRAGVIAALARCAESRVRAVILTGAGRAFSSGAALEGNVPNADEANRQLIEEYAPGIRAIAALEKPVIAAVTGMAVGIGMSYALACDMVVMGEGAFMQVSFGRIGLVPDGGLCWHLATRLGPRVAFEVAVCGEPIDA